MAAEPAAPSALVKLDRVSMAYGRGATAVRAIEEVSLEIAHGEFIAVVGPSGCGKSSLMKLISGLHPPLAGALTVEGRAVRGPVKSVGMAFQNSNLLPWRSALDNVLLPLEIVQPYRDDFRSNRKQYARKAEELLGSVGLAGFAQKFPWELSGGMQQRASICRALIHEPEILMLDEPVAGMNREETEDMARFILDVRAEWGVTVLMVEHDMGMVMDLSDHVVVLNFGQVIAQGTPAVVQADPEVNRAYLGSGDVGDLRRKLQAGATTAQGAA